MKYLLTILTVCILFGCEQKETKKIISRYKNGNPKIVYYFKNTDDTLTYRKEVFYESGKQNYIGEIAKGKKDGIWIWWYENGNKKDQCKYSDGFYVDTVYHWYSNGQFSQIEIVAGRKVRTDGCCSCNGTIIRFYENGKMKEKFTSLDDKFQGTFTTYEENGEWRMRTFKDDILSGPTEEHSIDSNKLTIVIGQYENDKETGLWKWFDKDSILISSVIFVNGISKGEYIQYYPTGKIKNKGNVIDDDYEGLVYYYDENGKTIKTENYKNGFIIH